MFALRNSLFAMAAALMLGALGAPRPAAASIPRDKHTNLTSAAILSGLAVAEFNTDFYGNWRHPATPCRGAIEIIFGGGGGGGTGGGDVRDGGGRLVKRVIQGREQALGYDGRNRLTAWSWGGASPSSATYVYDHEGRRVRVTEVSGSVTATTRYIYDGADVVTEYVDADGDGAVERTRIYWLLPDMDQRIGFADIVGGVPQFYYYITDHVGTVLRIVDGSGVVVNQYDYDAWGNVRWGSSQTFETVKNRYLFQGREWDRAGGFYYFRNRIYLPERGEFASPDMNLNRGILGELDGMGTTAFCGNDPVNNVDPLGLRVGFREVRDDKGMLIRVEQYKWFPGKVGKGYSLEAFNDITCNGLYSSDGFDERYQEILEAATDLYPLGDLSDAELDEAVERGYIDPWDVPIHPSRNAYGELENTLSYREFAWMAGLSFAGEMFGPALNTFIGAFEGGAGSAFAVGPRMSRGIAAKSPLARLQSSVDDLAEQHVLPEFRALDPNLKAGYTGSFKTGTVGNPNKATFGQPIDLNKFDIDYWIESDILFQKFGPNLKANPAFRKILSETPGFEGLKPNKAGFSIKFKPSGG